MGSLDFSCGPSEYSSILNATVPFKHNLVLKDHLGGFNVERENSLLKKINSIQKDVPIDVTTEYIFDDIIKEKYNNIRLLSSSELIDNIDFLSFRQYNIHPEINFRNFLCSFNGSDHVSRQLLTAILNNQGYFNSDYCSKNFIYPDDKITSQLHNLDLADTEIRLYRKFFSNSYTFNNSIFSFGHVRFDHATNIYNLEHKLTQSFLHLVSETIATSYYPYYSEKFLYSVVTRGLFVTYAQPGWHEHLEKYYGFKKYDKIFNYKFDEIQNPVKRLVALIEMISKFKSMSSDDWNDLYLMELDTIEYNYDHYFSGDYLKCLAHYE
jgi:hypothetical protein